METKMYRLFGKNGGMEELKPNGGLPKFTKLSCFFMAGSYGTAMVVEEVDEHKRQKACYISGDRKGFFYIDQYIQPESKEFGIGTYYNDALEKYSDYEAQKIIDKAIIEEQQIIAEVKAKDLADKQEKENLLLVYPMLRANYSDDFKITKINLVSLLKAKFKGFKFSVKKDYYNSYDVSWENGPTEDEVREVTDLFVSYQNDFTGDFRDYEPTNFNRVFGGFKYVSTQRNKSQEIQDLLPIIKEQISEEEIKNDFYYAEKVLGKIFSKTSFSICAKIKGIKKLDVNTDVSYNFFSIDIEQETKTNLQISNFEIIDYSEKAIAVIGETKSICEELKKIGGRFNSRLSCGAGWVFPKNKENSVKLLLESL